MKWMWAAFPRLKVGRPTWPCSATPSRAAATGVRVLYVTAEESASQVRLRAQRTGNIVQIPNLVSLIRCERNGLNCPVAAFILLPIRLCDKSLHLHIGRCHQRTGHTVQVNALIALVHMKCL